MLATKEARVHRAKRFVFAVVKGNEARSAMIKTERMGTYEREGGGKCW